MAQRLSGVYFTVDEVAALTGVTPRTVRNWILKGVIRATPMGGVHKKTIWLIEQREIERMILDGYGKDTHDNQGG